MAKYGPIKTSRDRLVRRGMPLPPFPRRKPGEPTRRPVPHEVQTNLSGDWAHHSTWPTVEQAQAEVAALKRKWVHPGFNARCMPVILRGVP